MIEGVVIRSFPSGESDLVLRVISSSCGKISLLAKHARKSRKRFGASFDLFDRGLFEIKRGSGNLATVVNFSPQPSLMALRDDLDKFSIGSLLCECFDMLVHEDIAEAEEIFEILSMGFQALAEATDLKQSLRTLFITLASLLRISGFMGGEIDPKPSSKNLLRLLQIVEGCAEKKLICAADVLELVEKL